MWWTFSMLNVMFTSGFALEKHYINLVNCSRVSLKLIHQLYIMNELLRSGRSCISFALMSHQSCPRVTFLGPDPTRPAGPSDPWTTLCRVLPISIRKYCCKAWLLFRRILDEKFRTSMCRRSPSNIEKHWWHSSKLSNLPLRRHRIVCNIPRDLKFFVNSKSTILCL